MIHTIGNSHCDYGFNQIEGIACHVIGPILMHSIGRDGIDIRKYGIQDGDTVIFCVGEIDCRCHVHKYSNDYHQNITNIVNKYVERIKENLEFFNCVKFCVYCVPPPCRERDIKGTHMYPTLGSDEDRRKYTEHMNTLLRSACEQHNIIFFDVYDKYCCPEGFLIKELSDQCHITDSIHIKEFIDKNLKE